MGGHYPWHTFYDYGSNVFHEVLSAIRLLRDDKFTVHTYKYPKITQMQQQQQQQQQHTCTQQSH